MAIVVGQTTWQEGSAISLGCVAPLGGTVICRNGGVSWIVAPNTSEVSRNWDNRNDAITTARACTATTTWFIPSVAQLQNPGYCCRTLWNSYSVAVYWSNAAGGGARRCFVDLSTGFANYRYGSGPIECVRAFRCVTY
jgi:hypothetical protein